MYHGIDPYAPWPMPPRIFRPIPPPPGPPCGGCFPPAPPAPPVGSAIGDVQAYLPVIVELFKAIQRRPPPDRHTLWLRFFHIGLDRGASAEAAAKFAEECWSEWTKATTEVAQVHPFPGASPFPPGSVGAPPGSPQAGEPPIPRHD